MHVTLAGSPTHDTDFGFFTPAAAEPGHRHAGILEEPPGGVAGPERSRSGRDPGPTTRKPQAIAWLGKVGKDKTTTMFSSLVPAMLNVLIGNDGSCVNSTIATPTTGWRHSPVGSGVAASSAAWAIGEPSSQTDGRLQQRPALRSASKENSSARWPFDKGRRAALRFTIARSSLRDRAYSSCTMTH